MKHHKTTFKLPIKQNKFLFPSLRNMTLNPFADYDKDGVNNAIDCRPFNKRFQDVKPNWMQRERLSKLPLYLSEAPIRNAPAYTFEKKKAVHLTSSKAPKRLQTKVYTMFKNYPQLIGEIEQRKPSHILFTSGHIKTSGTKNPTELGGFAKWRSQEVAVSLQDNPNERSQEKKYDFYDTVMGVNTTAHELEHVRQAQVSENKPALVRRWTKGKYRKQPAEVKAYAAGQRFIQSYQRGGISAKDERYRRGFTEQEGDPLHSKKDLQPKEEAVERLEERKRAGMQYVTKEPEPEKKPSLISRIKEKVSSAFLKKPEEVNQNV